MSFTSVNYSQQDPAWKSVKIGSSGETIGHVGCAITSVAMLLSGHGYNETPKTLNAKLKARGGYVDAAIIWGAVTSIYPQIVYRNLVLCRDTNAPLAQINTAIAAGQPVLVEVDSSPKAGLQTHWVVLYGIRDNDYLMLDPWPYPTESGQEVLLMSRYSHGKPLKKSITAAVFYECLAGGGGSSGGTTTTTPITPTEPGVYVQIPVTVSAGLRMRTQATTASDTVAVEPPGTFLQLLEPEATALPKIGVYDQWIKVADPQGRQGYVAAWYVEKGLTVGETTEPPTTEPGSGSTKEPSETPSEPTPTTPTEPEPETETLTVYVSQSVGAAGLRLRKQPSLGGSLVTVEKAGAPLTVLEPAKKAKPKIGVPGQWINVMDAHRMQGYVAANYVGLASEPASPPETETPTSPPPTSDPLIVSVSSAATAGLRMRSGPNTKAATVKVLAARTNLTVLEGTENMVGTPGKWLKVRDSAGDEGYVAAWFVTIRK